MSWFNPSNWTLPAWNISPFPNPIEQASPLRQFNSLLREWINSPTREISAHELERLNALLNTLSSARSPTAQQRIVAIQANLAECINFLNQQPSSSSNHTAPRIPLDESMIETLRELQSLVTQPHSQEPPAESLPSRLYTYISNNPVTAGAAALVGVGVLGSFSIPTLLLGVGSTLLANEGVKKLSTWDAKKAFFGTPDEDLYRLVESIDKILEAPERVTREDLLSFDAILNALPLEGWSQLSTADQELFHKVKQGVTILLEFPSLGESISFDVEATTALARLKALTETRIQSDRGWVVSAANKGLQQVLKAPSPQELAARAYMTRMQNASDDDFRTIGNEALPTLNSLIQELAPSDPIRAAVTALHAQLQAFLNNQVARSTLSLYLKRAEYLLAKSIADHSGFARSTVNSGLSLLPSTVNQRIAPSITHAMDRLASTKPDEFGPFQSYTPPLSEHLKEGLKSVAERTLTSGVSRLPEGLQSLGRALGDQAIKLTFSPSSQSAGEDDLEIYTIPPPPGFIPPPPQTLSFTDRMRTALRPVVTSMVNTLPLSMQPVAESLADHILPSSTSASSSSSSSTKQTGMLGSILSFIWNSAKRYSAEKSGFLLLSTLIHATQFLPKKGFGKQRAKIDQILDLISTEVDAERTLRKNVNWKKLGKVIHDSVSLLNGINVSVNGFNLPKFGPQKKTRDTSRFHFEDITKIRKALPARTDTSEIEGANWKQLARQERRNLVQNSTNFLVIKTLFEKVHGRTPNTALYYQLVQKSNLEATPEERDAKLKELFFAEIDQAHKGFFAQLIHFPKRVWTQISYSLLTNIFHGALKNVSRNSLNEVFGYIRKNKSNDYVHLKNMLVTNLTKYLTILGGAYERIATGNNPHGTIAQMLHTELEKPEYNLVNKKEYTTKALYTELAQVLLEKCTNNALLKWIIQSWAFEGVIWIFEKISGLDRGDLVGSILNEGVNSLSDENGYTHALNTVLIEQLEEVLALILEKSKSTKHATPTHANGKLSEHKKLEIKALVKNVVEILQKGECQTRDELLAHIQGKTPFASLKKVYNGVIMEGAIGSITELISEMLNELLQEDQLHKLIYKFTRAANTMYTQGESFSDAQVKATEKNLQQLQNRILNVAIQSAVDEALDSDGKIKKNKTASKVQDLNSSTQEFIKKTAREYKRLTSHCHTPSDLKRSAMQAKVDSLLELTHSYRTNCLDQIGEITDGEERLDNATTQALVQRYDKVRRETKPLLKALRELKHGTHRLAHNRELHKPLQKIYNTAESITRRISEDPSKSTQSHCNRWIETLQQNINQIKKLRIEDKAIHSIEKTLSTLLANLRSFAGLQHKINICDGYLKQAKKWKTAKQIKNLDDVRDQIDQIKDVELKNIILRALNKFLNNSEYSTGSFSAALREFNRAIRQERDKLAATRGKTKQTIERNADSINQTIATQGLLQSTDIKEAQEERINTALQTAREELDRLDQWHNGYTDVSGNHHPGFIDEKIPHINIKLIPPDVYKTTISKFVFNEAKTTVDSLAKFARRPETALFGVARHLGIIPYLEHVKAVKKG